MKFYCFVFCFIFVTIWSCTKPGTDIQVLPSPPTPPIVVNPKIPILHTDTISNLTLFSVTFEGKIIDTGGSKVSEKGFVVGLTTGATIQSNFKKFKIEADSSGHFQTIVIDLPANTTFFLRAYGINEQGEGYGNEVKFSSLNEKIFNAIGPVKLTTQKEVNDLGAQKYTSINNGVEINGNDITDLSPLNTIIKIGGELSIIKTSLINLAGLEQLEVIGNSFFNTSFIEYNPNLKDLNGLNNLKIIRGSIQFVKNPELINLNGLNNLGIIHGGSLSIYECNKLQNLNGLEKLAFLDGRMILQHNIALQNIKGLKNLETVIEDFRIIGSPLLTNLDGLEKVKNIHTLELTDNSSISNLNGLRNLKNLNLIKLEGNSMLWDLSALKNLTTIQYLTIIQCNSLTDLTGFSGIQTITGRLTVYNNPNLRELKGLENLHTAGYIQISNNKSLIDLKGLDSLKHLVGSGYSLGIAENESLISLNGLENLKTAEGQIYIEVNSSNFDYCALKFFLNQYKDDKFFLVLNGLDITKEDVISKCQ